ncbi:FHA domain-containing protein [Paraliomyxa miuraensis]|uniref:FHA domain-containing protein n=1 Tax=Paraliomyxa miuraensis TaxID=376150 RepID=UPI002B1CDED7|nr:FHA domain-containing protein [Paraliomyxa miuraensis]
MQDLRSRNGTYVDGQRLVPGQPVPVARGAALGFGHPSEYEMIDAGPPEPVATGVEPTEGVVEGQGARLLLPDPADPELVVVHRDGRWWLERDGTRSIVEDGDVVCGERGSWSLWLPELVPSTLDVSDGSVDPPTLASVELRLSVAGAEDERAELVELVVSRGDRSTPLEPRAHHRPLLLLAKARRDDRSHHLEEERGWVEQEALCDQLGYTTGRLHVEIHRLRREFAANRHHRRPHGGRAPATGSQPPARHRPGGARGGRALSRRATAA